MKKRRAKRDAASRRKFAVMRNDREEPSSWHATAAEAWLATKAHPRGTDPWVYISVEDKWGNTSYEPLDAPKVKR